MMKLSLIFLILVGSLIFTCRAQEFEDDEEDSKEGSTWWQNFKQRVKSVLSKWKEDIKNLWSDVVEKAADMRSWTADMYESLKLKLKEWLETRPEIPDDEKNEIETLISKLKVPTEKPKIDP